MKDMESTKSSLDKARQRFEDQREKLNKDTGSGRLTGRTNLNALQLSETDYPIIRGFKSLIIPNKMMIFYVSHHYHLCTSSILLMLSVFFWHNHSPKASQRPGSSWASEKCPSTRTPRRKKKHARTLSSLDSNTTAFNVFNCYLRFWKHTVFDMVIERVSTLSLTDALQSSLRASEEQDRDFRPSQGGWYQSYDYPNARNFPAEAWVWKENQGNDTWTFFKHDSFPIHMISRKIYKGKLGLQLGNKVWPNVCLLKLSCLVLVSPIDFKTQGILGAQRRWWGDLVREDHSETQVISSWWMGVYVGGSQGAERDCWWRPEFDHSFQGFACSGISGRRERHRILGNREPWHRQLAGAIVRWAIDCHGQREWVSSALQDDQYQWGQAMLVTDGSIYNAWCSCSAKPSLCVLADWWLSTDTIRSLDGGQSRGGPFDCFEAGH